MNRSSTDVARSPPGRLPNHEIVPESHLDRRDVGPPLWRSNICRRRRLRDALNTSAIPMAANPAASDIPQCQACREAVSLLNNDGFEAAWSTLWAPLFSDGCDVRSWNAARSIVLIHRPTPMWSVVCGHFTHAGSVRLRSAVVDFIIETGSDGAALSPTTYGLSSCRCGSRWVFDLWLLRLVWLACPGGRWCGRALAPRLRASPGSRSRRSAVDRCRVCAACRSPA